MLQPSRMSTNDNERPSHDQALKQLIDEFTRESIVFFAGAEGRAVSPGAKLTPLRQEQLSPRLGKGFREIDSAVLAEQPDAPDEILLFLVEEEARPSRAAVYRIAEYVLLLAQWLEREHGSAAVV